MNQEKQKRSSHSVVRERYRLCPACGNFANHSANQVYCTACGEKLISQCRECGEPIIYPTARFCPACGTALVMIKPTA